MTTPTMEILKQSNLRKVDSEASQASQVLQQDQTSPSELPAILALDPGGTTGWCLWDPGASQRQLLRGELDDQNHYHKLFQFLLDCINDRIATRMVIVCERFEFRQQDSQNRSKIDYISGEYVGVVKLLAQMYKNTPIVKLVMQSASQIKGQRDDDPTVFFHDGRLKELDLWIPGMRHAMDATKHYAYYRTFTLRDATYLHMLKDK